jgi:hypothetical protein
MKPMNELMRVFAVCTAMAGLAIGAGVVSHVEEQRFHEAQRKYPGQWVFGDERDARFYGVERQAAPEVAVP